MRVHVKIGANSVRFLEGNLVAVLVGHANDLLSVIGAAVVTVSMLLLMPGVLGFCSGFLVCECGVVGSDYFVFMGVCVVVMAQNGFEEMQMYCEGGRAC